MSGVFIYLLLLIDRSVEYNSELHIPSFSLTTAGGTGNAYQREIYSGRNIFVEMFLNKKQM